MPKEETKENKHYIKKAAIAVAKYTNSMHIYPSFKEALVKTIVFIASWVISVFCYYGLVGSSSPQNAQGPAIRGTTMLGGAVVLFSISFLLEVFDRTNDSDPPPRRITASAALLSSIVCLVLGLLTIFVENINLNPNLLIIICTLPVIVYMLDAITQLLIPPVNLNQCPEAGLRLIKFNGK